MISHAKSPVDVRNAGGGTIGLGSQYISPQEYSPPRPKAFWNETCQVNDEAHRILRDNIAGGSLYPAGEVEHESREEVAGERTISGQERVPRRLSRGESRGLSESVIVSRNQCINGDSRNSSGRAIEEAPRIICGGISPEGFILLLVISVASFGFGALIYPWPQKSALLPASTSLLNQEIAPVRSSSKTVASGPTVFEMRARSEQKRKSDRWALGEDARDFSRVDHATKRAFTVREHAGGIQDIENVGGNPPASAETESSDSPRPSSLHRESKSFQPLATVVNEIFNWDSRAESFDGERRDQGRRSSTTDQKQRQVFVSNREAFARTVGVAEQRLYLASSEVQLADLPPAEMSWRVASTAHAARRACDSVASGGARFSSGSMGGRGTCDESSIGDETVRSKVGYAKAGISPSLLLTDPRDPPSLVEIEDLTRTAAPDEAIAPPYCDRLVVSGDGMPARFNGIYTLVTDEHRRLTPGIPSIPSPPMKLTYYIRNTERIEFGESAELQRGCVPGAQQPSSLQGASKEERGTSDRRGLEYVRRDSLNDAVDQSPAAKFSAPEGVSNGAVDPPEDASVDPSLEVRDGNLYLYWVSNDGGRWVLDDDLSLSTGVLAVTADRAPQAPCAVFPISPQSQGFLADLGRDAEGHGGCGGASFRGPSWLVDSPRLRRWLPADNFEVLCEID